MTATLEPLAYHVEIAARLEALEPASWAAMRQAADAPAPGPSARGAIPTAAGVLHIADVPLDPALLRSADRLDAAAHPRVHAAAARAASALEVLVPLAIYRLEAGGRPGLSLVYRPQEAVIALAGDVFALLTDDELVAAFGHELAHHRLWSVQAGRFLVAERLLRVLRASPSTPAPYLETARRFGLAGELYADRGALLACGSLETAVASLVKVATGLAEVDVRAFLAQAEAARPGAGSGEATQAETALRASALERWRAASDAAAGVSGPDTAAVTLLAPGLDIERLDLLDRDRLEAATRALILDVLRIDWWRTDAVLAHARQFFPDITAAAVPPPIGPPTALPAGASEATLRYLAFVLLDLATVDPDLDDEPLPIAVALARAIGLGPVFEAVARQELVAGDRAWQVVLRKAADLVPPPAPVAGPTPADAPTGPVADPTPADVPTGPVAPTVLFPDA